MICAKVCYTFILNVPSLCLEKIQLLLKKNPKGLVPVLIDRRGEEEVVVYESLICVEYVDECFEYGPKLLPGSASQRANARMWSEMLNNTICSNFYTLLMKQDESSQKDAAEKILSSLRKFSRHCVGPYFYGEQLSIVDITIAPWMVGTRMGVLKTYRNFEVPQTEEYAKYWAWYEAVITRPSFIATSSDEDLQAMIDVYKPYAEGTGFVSSTQVKRADDRP
jgi:glutathione S-transferase